MARIRMDIIEEFGEFLEFFWDYVYRRMYTWYQRFEASKDKVVDVLYRKRGKYARPFVHSGMVGLLFLGVTVGPAVLEGQADELQSSELPQPSVLGVSTEDVYAMGTHTMSSERVLEYRGGEVVEYEVQEGETLSLMPTNLV